MGHFLIAVLIVSVHQVVSSTKSGDVLPTVHDPRVVEDSILDNVRQSMIDSQQKAKAKAVNANVPIQPKLQQKLPSPIQIQPPQLLPQPQPPPQPQQLPPPPTQFHVQPPTPSEIMEVDPTIDMDDESEVPRSSGQHLMLRSKNKMNTIRIKNLGPSGSTRRQRPDPPIHYQDDEMYQAANNNNLNQADDGGEIVYEDDFPNELSDWIPPPPPPPSAAHFRPLRGFPSSGRPASTSLSSIFRRGTSARLFGDDFALFLVILTIAGFFGLMLAFLMPFTFLLQQQPGGLGGGLGGYPGVGSLGGYPGVGNIGVQAISSNPYGYPYGRRRKREVALSLLDEQLFEERLEQCWAILASALEKYLDDILRPFDDERSLHTNSTSLNR